MRKTAEDTDIEWPIKVCLHCPMEAFQILTVLSLEAVSTSDPSVEKNADVTQPEWPVKV